MAAHISPEKKLAVLQDIMSGQFSRIALGEAHQVSLSSVDRLREAYKNRKSQSLAQLAGIGNGKSKTEFKSVEKLSAAIHSMHAGGMTGKEIAAQLKVSAGTVGYHLYIRKKLNPGIQALVVSPSPSQNGGQINGINKHVFVGIYVAEAERLGHHIGERFGVSSDFLRSGLSEFLEYTKVRRAPRHGD